MKSDANHILIEGVLYGDPTGRALPKGNDPTGGGYLSEAVIEVSEQWRDSTQAPRSHTSLIPVFCHGEAARILASIAGNQRIWIIGRLRAVDTNGQTTLKIRALQVFPAFNFPT